MGFNWLTRRRSKQNDEALDLLISRAEVASLAEGMVTGSVKVIISVRIYIRTFENPGFRSPSLCSSILSCLLS
jgi:hypothetical protein